MKFVERIDDLYRSADQLLGGQEQNRKMTSDIRHESCAYAGHQCGKVIGEYGFSELGKATPISAVMEWPCRHHLRTGRPLQAVRHAPATLVIFADVAMSNADGIYSAADGVAAARVSLALETAAS